VNIEPIRFSDLKYFARSPAHFRDAIENPRRATAAMDLGAIAHRLVLGPRQGDGELAVWTGGRRFGKTWDAFVEAHASDVIVTAKDFAAAKRIAAAIRADETAAALLEGARLETPLGWNEDGLRAETRGIDIIKPLAGMAVHVAELKTTTNTEPGKLQRQAMTMLYPQQLEWYRGALVQKGHDVQLVSIIGVEVTPPHAVTVLALTPDLLAWARKSIALWLERLRVCLAEDHWPAYRQRAETFDLPAWLVADGPAEEEDDEDEPVEAA
jgi:hypothetical protein